MKVPNPALEPTSASGLHRLVASSAQSPKSQVEQTRSDYAAWETKA